MRSEKFYLGIDLGTTNSCLHWGVFEDSIQMVRPEPIQFDQRIAGGNVMRRHLQPSFIWFRQNSPVPIIGEHAKVDGIEAQPSRVVHAIKNHMGDPNWRFEIDDSTYSATELASMLLRNLLNGIPPAWGIRDNQPNVVITVPASFDDYMREATIEAARSAGFNIIDDTNNRLRNMLLDEPRAALYDLLNQQSRGKLPASVIDFSTQKSILVFDLGGGTLDVSLHNVAMGEETFELDVEDLAIGRYTQIGGGRFDKLIAEHLLSEYETSNSISYDDLNDIEKRALELTLLSAAENFKQSLTIEIQQRLDAQLPVDEALTIDVSIYAVGGDMNKSLFTTLSKSDFQNMVDPLLAWNLTLDDVDTVNQLDEAHVDNIIYPILDVLKKAQDKLGQMPKIDAVILNGGMTRVHAIQERLEAFFDFKPLNILDPELSVSRGAVVYHHALQRGLKPRSILAESIGLHVYGDRIEHLVPAGTVLPVQKRLDGAFSVPYDNATAIRIPLYRGERKVPAPPNRKLTERSFILQKAYSAGTAIDVDISIDQNKIIELSANISNNPIEKVKVVLSADQQSLPQKAIEDLKKKFEPQGIYVDPHHLMRDFETAGINEDMERIKSIEQEILSAKNIVEIVDNLLKKVGSTNHLTRSRILFILGEIIAKYPEHPRKSRIIDVCKNYSSENAFRNSRNITSSILFAVTTLGKAMSASAENHLINLLFRKDVSRILQAILISLGKCGNSNHALYSVQKHLESNRVGIQISAVWSLGRIGSREKKDALPLKSIKEYEIIKKIQKLSSRPDIENMTLISNSVYAIGEIADQRRIFDHPHFLEKSETENILSWLNDRDDHLRLRIRSNRNLFEKNKIHHTRKMINVVEKMVQGIDLQEDEVGVLMAVRTLMGS